MQRHLAVDDDIQVVPCIYIESPRAHIAETNKDKYADDPYAFF